MPKEIIPVAEPDLGPEVLASVIADVADSAKKLRSSRLTDRALLLLIQDNCRQKVSLQTIGAVLDSAEGLAAKYLKQSATPKKRK